MKTHFDIFGDPVEIVVFSEQTGGSFSIGQQTCAPGGGPPPHFHQDEDEVFLVIDGHFELFDGETWTKIPANRSVYCPRGKVHCFRNSGETHGTIQFTCSGNRFDVFIEGLSRFHIPEDLQAMVDYSAEFKIFYPTLPPPTKPVEA